MLHLRRSAMLVPGLLLMASAILYLLGNAFMLLSADARYQPWAWVAFIVVVVMALVEIARGRSWPCGEDGVGRPSRW